MNQIRLPDPANKKSIVKFEFKVNGGTFLVSVWPRHDLEHMNIRIIWCSYITGLFGVHI